MAEALWGGLPSHIRAPLRSALEPVEDLVSLLLYVSKGSYPTAHRRMNFLRAVDMA